MVLLGKGSSRPRVQELKELRPRRELGPKFPIPPISSYLRINPRDHPSEEISKKWLLSHSYRLNPDTLFQ